MGVPPDEGCRRGGVVSGADGPAEFGAAGAGVCGDFFGGGEDGAGGDFAVGASAFSGEEGFFYAAVFAGVEGDDGGGAVFLEAIGQNGEEAFEVGHFAVDEDAEGLEGAGRGMEFGAGGAFEGKAARLADHGGQFLGSFDGFVLTAIDDESGDLRGVGFVTVFEEGFGDFGFGHAGEEGGGGLAAGGIHAHVQRAGLAIGESALWVVDLRGRDAQVGQYAIDRENRASAGFGENRWQRGENCCEPAKSDFLDPGTPASRFCAHCQRCGIKIKTNDAAPRQKRRGATNAACPPRPTVQSTIIFSRFRPERLEDFLWHHGEVQ